MNTEIKNAIIAHATITRADHNCLTGWLMFDYGNGDGQGFGGQPLYRPKTSSAHTLHSLAGHFIYRVLEIADVLNWSDLVSKTVRVRITDNGIDAIGHIVKDDWFCPRDAFETSEPENAPQQPPGLPRTVAQMTQDRTNRNAANVSDSERIAATGPWPKATILAHWVSIDYRPCRCGYYFVRDTVGKISVQYYLGRKFCTSDVTYWLDIPSVSDSQTTETATGAEMTVILTDMSNYATR